MKYSGVYFLLYKDMLLDFMPQSSSSGRESPSGVMVA